MQVLDLMFGKHGRTFGDLKPANVIMAGRTLKLVDFSSSVAPGQGVCSVRFTGPIVNAASRLHNTLTAERVLNTKLKISVTRRLCCMYSFVRQTCCRVFNAALSASLRMLPDVRMLQGNLSQLLLKYPSSDKSSVGFCRGH